MKKIVGLLLVIFFSCQTWAQSVVLSDSGFTLKVRGLQMAFMLLPEGRFQMGNDFSPFNDEKPAHLVVLPSFYMSRYEVTFAEFDKFCEITGRDKPNDNGWGRGQRPVINVSWEEATLYCKWLSYETGYAFRLPTEAEWEYAAGSGERYAYSGSDDLSTVAWYRDNSNGQTQTVGRKAPNNWGLYDMSGNVWEWCSDWYASYKKELQVSPQGPTSATYKVFRGGGWIDDNKGCRISDRNRATSLTSRFNYLGFRIVCTSKTK